VHSAAGVVLPPGGLVQRPPFRAPHHTSSVGSLVGGGSHQLRPGEISLSHGGVLFLDEMGQFAPKALDGLREALETGQIMVGRVEQLRVPMPARFQLVGATNPCPCGAGAPCECECDERVRHRYISRLSGPFLDRFDLRIAVQRPDVDEMLGGEAGESTAEVAARVAKARRVAFDRAGVLNAELDDTMLHEFAPLDADAERMLRVELERGRLTGRGYHRVRRVARTLADLAGRVDGSIGEDHVATAIAMRTRVGTSSLLEAA
jgi:magnesium chelatase family protein